MSYPESLDLKYLLELYGDNVIASMTNTKGYITFVSSAYEKISGYTKDELLGQPHNIVRHPDMDSALFQNLWETIKLGNVWKGEVKNLKKDGAFYWVNATVTPQTNKDGKIIGYASIREDITDKKETKVLHTQIENILNNIEDGFLTFDKSLQIKESHSKKCLDILHQDDITTKNISEILFSNDGELKETFQFGCTELFKTNDRDVKEMYLSLLPTQHYNSSNKFTIHYKLLENGEILVLLRDTTKEVKLKKKIRFEQKLQHMLITIAKHKLETIDLIESFKIFLENLKNEMNINTLKLELHTFKGLFSQLHMIHTSDAIHNIETQTKLKVFQINQIKDLEEAFSNDMNIIDDIFGSDFLNPVTTVAVELDRLNELKYKVKDILNSTQENQNKLYDLLHDIKEMRNQPLFEMLNIYSITVENLSKSVNKPMYPLEIIGDKNIVVNEEFRNFTKSLIHIFRNCLVHGIEDDETRLENLKDLKGKIQCSFEMIKDEIIIHISDDGYGLDVSRIKLRLLELNLVSQNEILQLSENEILQYIFTNEFSTKNNVDELSGRGVGLASVRYELEKLDGKITILNNHTKGLKFMFTIPYKKEKIDEAKVLSHSFSSRFETFLKKDMGIECTPYSEASEFNLETYYSMINITGKKNLLCSIILDNGLLDKIYDVFTNGEKVEEELDVKKSLTDEIINIVAGLSLQDFPKKYSSLTLGIPLLLGEEILTTFVENNKSKITKVETPYGNAQLVLIIMD